MYTNVIGVLSIIKIKKIETKRILFPQTGTNVQKLNDECEDYLLNVRIMIEIKIILIYLKI
jgi:hypothetical protein